MDQMDKKIFGSVKNFSGSLKNSNFKTTLKPNEMALSLFHLSELLSLFLKDFPTSFVHISKQSESKLKIHFNVTSGLTIQKAYFSGGVLSRGLTFQGAYFPGDILSRGLTLSKHSDFCVFTIQKAFYPRRLTFQEIR